MQCGIESVSNLGAKLWNPLPGEIKKSSSLFAFKQEKQTNKQKKNGSLKNIHASFARNLEKMSVIFNFSQTFARLAVAF